MFFEGRGDRVFGWGSPCGSLVYMVAAHPGHMAAREFPDFTRRGPSPSHWGEVSCVGSRLLGPARSSRSLFPSLCCLLCSAGQARMGTCCGRWTFLWLSSVLGAPRIWRNQAQSRCVCGQLCMCSQPVMGCSEVCVCARHTQRTYVGVHKDTACRLRACSVQTPHTAPSYPGAADLSLPCKPSSLCPLTRML